MQSQVSSPTALDHDKEEPLAAPTVNSLSAALSVSESAASPGLELWYRVWAPDHREIEVEIDPADGSSRRCIRMARRSQGYHEACDPSGRPGDKYRFVVHGSALPDPGSHSQAQDVHSWSVVVDHAAYKWGDTAWRRPPFRDLVIYELHVGTFTEEGTFRAAIEKLPHLEVLGVNAIEIMPIADFPGERSWGYDGVLIYAPARSYGTPDDLRALVDAAHQLGIAVILDVVYNHFGPDGNYLTRFSTSYFNPDRQTPWGASLNFDGQRSDAVRAFFLANPVFWMEYYHIDGFRLDATHAIIDQSRRHLLQEIAQLVHQRGGYVIAEDSRNDARLLESTEKGGYGLDAVWADDFHHVARVGQTQEKEAYYANFQGTIDELTETLVHGWLYRGQRADAEGVKVGTDCHHLPPSAFIHCLSNHDQAGNRAFGERLSQSVSLEAYRALSVLLCLTPYTPMLFMGQEWAASAPFLYFTDHNEELGRLVTEGRRREFAGFAAFSDPDILRKIPDPQAENTFRASKLNWGEITELPHASVHALYRQCLRLRRSENAFRPAGRDQWEVARLGSEVVGIRYQGDAASYLLLVDPFGGHSGDLSAEPIAQAEKGPWQLLLSSNEERFGGTSATSFDEGAQRFIFAAPETLLLQRKSA